MCLLEPLPPGGIFSSNALLAEMDHPPSSSAAAGGHFERLLATATMVSLMGTSQPEATSSPTRLNHPGSPSNSVASSTASSLSPSLRQRNNGLQQLCAMVTFLLGGPMPPTPGIIPLCWEELVDWTEEATALTVSIAGALGGRKKEEEERLLFPNHTTSSKRGHGTITFVPYVTADESEDVLKTLASRTYMERAQFYQESVRQDPSRSVGRKE